MNSKEIKGLVEAYTEVYAPTQEVDQFEDLSFVDDLSDNELVEIMEEILSEEEVTLQECLDVFDSEILSEESEMERMNRLMNKRTREKKSAAATAKREKSAERERVGRKHAVKRLQVAATRAGRNLADKAKAAGEKAKTLGAGAASAAAGGAAEAGRAAKSAASAAKTKVTGKLASAKEKIKGLVKSGRKAVAGGLRKLASKVEPKETDGKEVKAAAKSAVSSGRKPAPYRIVGKKSGVSGSGGTKALPAVGKTKSGKTLTQSQRDMQTSQQNRRLASRLGEDLELFALQILEDLIDEGYANDWNAALHVLESFSDYEVGDIVESYFGEATAMTKRGYDEAPIRQKIANATRGGKSADRATALAQNSTFRGPESQKARENLARKQRGDFRKTTSSNPGLHGYAHRSDDPKVKAKQAARAAQRSALTPNERKMLNMGDETFDTYDVVLEYLYVEGFAETLEQAEWMMANELSVEEIDSIVEAQLKYGGDNSPFKSRQDFLDSLRAYDEKQKKKTPEQRQAEVDAYAKRQREDK